MSEKIKAPLKKILLFLKLSIAIIIIFIIFFNLVIEQKANKIKEAILFDAIASYSRDTGDTVDLAEYSVYVDKFGCYGLSPYDKDKNVDFYYRADLKILYQSKRINGVWDELDNDYIYDPKEYIDSHNLRSFVDFYNYFNFVSYMKDVDI